MRDEILKLLLFLDTNEYMYELQVSNISKHQERLTTVKKYDLTVYLELFNRTEEEVKELIMTLKSCATINPRWSFTFDIQSYC